MRKGYLITNMRESFCFFLGATAIFLPPIPVKKNRNKPMLITEASTAGMYPVTAQNARPTAPETIAGLAALV